jgi:hypothetical protein
MSPLRPVRLSFTLFLITAATLPLGAATAADSAANPSPNHVLFMGTDLFVQHQTKLYRVEDVSGSNFRIKVDGQDIFVPTRLSPVNLRMDAELKLSGLSVQLDELKAGAGYTYGNDPLRKLEEANRNQMVTQDMQDTADAAVPRNEQNLAAIKEMAGHGGFGTAERAQREIATAQAQLDSSHHTVDYTTISRNSDSSSIALGAQRMALAEGNFDAMDVSFKISSAVELKQPYVVILFRFHDPAAKPGVNGLAIHAQALDPIDAKPRYVRVLRGGLPMGFKYVDCSVHIFNGRWEIATNQSDKRVVLTRSETQLYFVMNHVGAHKGETLAATAVPGTLPLVQRGGLSTAQLIRTIYAKVGSDGALKGVFQDKDCNTPLEDAQAKAALDEIFFTPALEQGKLVDGVARVRLAEI